MNPERLRIALLTYRGNPHSGGQGVYARYLSKALADLGHHVDVISGPPYPDLHEGVGLTKLPSLDLYRAGDPFRRPRRDEFRDAVDVAEYALMSVASYPEPLTFSLRAARHLSRAEPYDVVHDNQSLGYGLLTIQKRTPVVATIHHPCSIDRDLAVAAAPNWHKKLSLHRWYGFTKMQGRVARRLRRIVTVSETARDGVMKEFGVAQPDIAVVHNGVDTELFRPLEHIARVPGRILTTTSSDVPLKGLVHLIEAMAKVRTERDATLVVIGKPKRRGPVAQAIDRFGLGAAVEFKNGIGWPELVEEYARAEIAVVPSLYEGFSLPAIEAMACGVPLVTSTGGALPEVVGINGDAALQVPPGDAGEMAGAIALLLDQPQLRAQLGAKGRKAATERFSWRQAAHRTAEEYRVALGC